MFLKSLKDKIEHLLSVFLDKDRGESGIAVEKHQYFDLEELVAERRNKSELLSANKEQDDNNFSSNCGWKVSQGATQWQLIPFGEILGVSYVTPTCLELSSHGEDTSLKEVDRECVNLTENHLVINREAVDENNDDDDDNDDDGDNMCIDNEESCQRVQDYEADIIPVEDQNGESLEQENSIGSISNQIYLF